MAHFSGTRVSLKEELPVVLVGLQYQVAEEGSRIRLSVERESRSAVSRSRRGLLGTSDTQSWLGSLFSQLAADCCVSGVSAGTH